MEATLHEAAEPLSTPKRAASGFPVADLQFAKAWADVAPGGWSVIVDATGEGELVSVCPPGCEIPVFVIGLEDGAVETLRFRHAELGGAAISAGCHRSLPEALRALCPLSCEQMETLRACLRAQATN